MSAPPKYAAFISYSSKDSAFARRLHRALEGYRIPGALVEFHLSAKGLRNRLYPIFRDREELPSGELGKVIDEALAASGALIIVCSPNAAASQWVNKEIETFLRSGRRDRIFAIMADDAPLSTAENPDATALSFPPAFRGEHHDAGFTPVVGDARPGRDGFRNAWLKVAAGVAATNLGSLQDRDAARRVQRTLTFSGMAIALVAVLAGLLASLSIQNVNAWAARSQQAVQLAEEALDDNRPEDALLLALAGLPAGRGHALAPPNANGLVILERALNEIVVTRAGDVKRQVGMMQQDYEPRMLGEKNVTYSGGDGEPSAYLLTRFGQIDVSTMEGEGLTGRTTFTRHGEPAPFAEVGSYVASSFAEAPAPSTWMAAFKMGIAFIDTAGKKPVCSAFHDSQIYHATFLGPSRALVSLTPYRAHLVIMNLDTCTAEGPPFALVVPYLEPDASSDDEEQGELRIAKIPAGVFPIVPLTLLNTPQGNVRDEYRDEPSFLAAAPEDLPTLRAESNIDAIIGLADDLIFMRASTEEDGRDRVILFDLKTRTVIAETSLAYVNREMGGSSLDDYVIDPATGLIIDLNSRRGLKIARGFSSFAIETTTDLTGATLAGDGSSLEAAGWSFDLKHALEISKGVIGSADLWREAQENKLAWEVRPQMRRERDRSRGAPAQTDETPALTAARKVLTSWFEEIGIGLINYDLDGRLPVYSIASSADASLVVITNGEQVWLRSADGSVAKRIAFTFPQDSRTRVAMAPDGSWFAALGAHEPTMQRLVAWNVATGRRFFDGLVSASAALNVVTGEKALWLDDARKISFMAEPDFPSLFAAACTRRPEGRRTLTPQMLKDLGLGASDADPCRNRFVLEHLWSEVFR